MPFTLSHAAAVLPAVRRTGTARGRLVASALVAGSFAPDMTYYADTLVPGGMEFGAVTHAPSGVLTVDVLITAALVGGWLVVRDPLLALVPAAFRGRVALCVRGRPWRARRPRELAAPAGWFVLSAVLGSLTHVVWDAFTHPGRWGTRLVPGLDRVVGGWPVPTYLQYGTSALAMTALVWFGWSALRAAGTAEPAVRAAAAAAVPVLSVRLRLLLVLPLSACVLAGAVHRVLRAHDDYGDRAVWFDYLPTALFGAGAGLIAGLLLHGLAVRLLDRRARGGRPADGPLPAARTGAAADQREAVRATD